MSDATSASTLDRRIASLHRELAALHERRARTLDTVSHDARVGADVLVSRGLAKSRKAVRERCAAGRVEGAVKVGHAWTCTIDAWIASGTAPRRRSNAETMPTDDEALADSFLMASGLRLTDGARSSDGFAGAAGETH